MSTSPATSSSAGLPPPLAAGTDLVEVRRIAALIERYGDRFLHRVFCDGELPATIAAGSSESLAARWAAKEAVAKALGTGIGQVSFREIEVRRDAAGRPVLALHGKAARLASAQGLTRWALSLAHDGGFALAFVVALGG